MRLVVPHRVRATSGPAEDRASVWHRWIAAVLGRRCAPQIGGQRAIYRRAGFVEGPGPLCLSGKGKVPLISVYEEASRQPGRRSKVDQM